MAEAHAAVAFSFSITHEGWDLNFDREMLNLVWQSGIRCWRKRFFRFYNNIKSGVYPASLESLWLMVLVIIVIHFTGFNIPYDPVGKISPYLFSSSVISNLTGCFFIGLLLWLIMIYTIRYILKLLLMYKGWIYELRGSTQSLSFTTTVWIKAVKLFSGWRKPMLYSYQSSLPSLPLPSIEDTMERYLKSVQPVLNKEEYKRMEKLASEFERGIGIKLQRYLILKSWWSVNYVSDWWEEFVYLRSRSPLIVNSNFYGIDAVLVHPTKIQCARAANVIHSCLLFRRLIERQELQPILVKGMVPLCSWQYERVFNTTRLPGIEIDKIVHFDDSKYVVIYHKGKYFKLPIYFKNRLLLPCEIELQIQSILDDKSQPQEGEEKLASLTAGNRTHWAKVREAHFSTGVNKLSLDTIERAAFFVVLDDLPYEYDKSYPEKLDNYSRILLHGKGHDRWFDKSFTLCIGSNGRIGFNAEHSWADAPIIGTLWEFSIAADVEFGYKEDGHTKGTPEFTPPATTRLEWDLNLNCLEDIETSFLIVDELLKSVDLCVYVHDSYGKGFMKNISLSPNTYIQMALQLAYYRDAKKFSLTYEASMTRLFREGRTETVRPCTMESNTWVKAMENESSTIEEKYQLLMNAAAQHQKGYQDAISGKGIDRHLFCLYVVSKYLEVDSPFLKEVLNEPWKLSISQIPHEQTSKLDLKKYPNCISGGGGFGPVADDGYGVCYITAGENTIFFHISSKHNSPETNSKRFANQIKRALMDMKYLFLENNKLQNQSIKF